MKKRALFLDRDGTIIRDGHYLKDPERIELINGIGPSLLKVRDAEYLLFLHTNQSGVARGFFEVSDVEACNQKMLHEYGWSEDIFTEICIATELPRETDGYRKPSPRFEEEMILKHDLNPSDCWVVGDKWIDAQTGLAAGMRGALVCTGKDIDESVKILAMQNNVPIHPSLVDFVNFELDL